MASVKVVLVKEKINKKGEAPLFLRIIKDCKPKYLGLSIYLPPEQWDEGKQRIRKSHPNFARLNNFLAQKIAEAAGIAFELEIEKKSVSSLAVKENIKGKAPPSFLKYFQDYIEMLKDTKKLGTHDKAFAVYLKLKTYLKGRDLTFEEVNYHFLKQYENYLRNKLGNTTNTVYSNFRQLRNPF
jgi:integrase/recombinase XerD